MRRPGATEATRRPDLLGAALAIAQAVSRVAVWLGGGALILVSCLVTLEVVLREVFLIGLSAATEISAYVLAASTAWAYAYTLLERNHVRVDAVIRLLPPRLLVWMDVLAMVALSWFAGTLLWHGWGVVGMSLETSAHAMTPLSTPLWIPQGLWVFGIAFFFATCLILLLRALQLVAAGEIRAASDLVGTFAREQEGIDEAEAAARRRGRHEEGSASA
jgi:TRAP-type C4-dicarboxylate transport system permease small subunit